MTDARWGDIRQDIETASDFYAQAVKLFNMPLSGGLIESSGLSAEVIRGMALMHLMQSAYTSAENAFLRILALFDEEEPTGRFWHKDLLLRMSRQVNRRPAFLSADLAEAAGESLRFRHVAMHAYQNFRIDRAGPGYYAAKFMAAELTPALDAFIAVVDGDGDAPPGPS